MFALAAVTGSARYYDLFGQAARANLRNSDWHASTSLDQALVLRFCGKYGYLSPRYDGDQNHFHGAKGVAPGTEYSAAIIARHGSIAQFCRGSVDRMLNNENALFLTLSALLALPPNDTPSSLATKMVAVRCALLFVTVYLASLFGMGIVPVVLVALATGKVLELTQQQHLLSMYPTMVLLLGLSGALITLICTRLERPARYSQLVLGIALGLALAMVFNFRSSYGIAVGAQIAAGLLVQRFWTSASGGYYARLAAGILAGFLAFQAVFIWPLERDYTGTNYANHPIWHPIVLGLANPPNPLGEREGIKWDDSVGLTLAQRIEPTAVYLSPSYERALRSYYVTLWQNYAGEMLGIYRKKLTRLGEVLSELVRYVFEDSTLSTAFAKIFKNGENWVAALLACVVLLILCYPLANALSLWGLTLAVGALYVSLEQAMIVSVFALAYQAPLIACVVALLATMLSIGAAAVCGSLARRLKARRLKMRAI
jgi:hypothetical protein